MDISIVRKNEQPLQSRTEITLDLTFSGATPSRRELRQALAKKTDSKEDLVVIQSISGKFGFGKADIVAHVYKDAASLKLFEPGHLTSRGIRKDKEEAAEKPAAKEQKQGKPEEKKDGKEEKKA